MKAAKLMPAVPSTQGEGYNGMPIPFTKTCGHYRFAWDAKLLLSRSSSNRIGPVLQGLHALKAFY